jgi:type II restriction/modification system DNA methylase subunit YeeA
LYGYAIGVSSPLVGPENMLGIEINPFAAELARVSVWIGEIQWMREHGMDASRNPILKPLDTIRCHDALLNQDGTEYEWPVADVIIGNPPYLGAKLMKGRLGVEETEKIRAAFNGRLPGFTDLVCYWFEKSRAMIETGTATRAGLVATNSIRKNTNLPVMHRIIGTTEIFTAWSEEQWNINGAAVDVSLICFGQGFVGTKMLDGQPVNDINADLTTGLDLTQATALAQNDNVAFLGIQKSGPFDVPGDLAREWMRLPANPNGKRNAAVLKPYWNGDDLTARPRDVWFIDLPLGLSESEAALFDRPFHHIATAVDEDGKTIKDLRGALGERASPRWWEPHWPCPEMRSRIASLTRFIVTPETAQYRLFSWLTYPVLPDKNLVVITRDDDTTFGILQSRLHSLWSLRKGSDLEDRPRYTHTTTFATFPFPEGLTPNVPATQYATDARACAIAAAARQLNKLREEWLNPAELVARVPEVVPAYPDRVLPKDEAAAAVLRKRTLTNLYNERPPWLAIAHKELDCAVAAAYGWTDWGAEGLPDDVILERLFKLNQERAEKQ